MTQRVIPVPAPGANSFSHTVRVAKEPGVRLLVKSVNYTLTTTATVGSRDTPLVITHKSGGIICHCGPESNTVASQVVRYSWYNGADQAQNDDPLNCSMPGGLEVDEGDVVSVSDVASIDTLDRITDISIVLEELLDPLIL